MQIVPRARFLLLAAMVAGCGSTPGASPPPGTPASSPDTIATVVPAASAIPVPAMITIKPVAYDLDASGLIWVTTDGTTVWAAVNDAVIRIDAATSKFTSLTAPSQADDTTLEIASDGLWMTRWGGSHVYRLDPLTGKVQLSVVFASAVRIAFVGKDLWVGRESTTEMLLVDRTTGTIGRALESGAYGAAGLGDLWFATGDSVKRIDPASGSLKASIKIQNEGNCTIYGTFPDNAWVSCFGQDVVPRAAIRLDPDGNVAATVANLPPCHGGSIVIVDGQPWFLGSFQDAAGGSFGGLLRLNADTGAIERFVSIGPADPDPAVVAGGALWIPDEAGHRMLRVDVAALRA